MDWTADDLAKFQRWWRGSVVPHALDCECWACCLRDAGPPWEWVRDRDESASDHDAEPRVS